MDKKAVRFPRWVPVAADALAAVVSLGGAALFRWGGRIPAAQQLPLLWGALGLAALTVAFEALGRQYLRLARYGGPGDLALAAGLAALAALAVLGMAWVSGGALSPAVAAASAVPLALLVILHRLPMALPWPKKTSRRVLVVGEGCAGAAAVGWARRQGARPVGLVTGDPAIKGAMVDGAVVTGPPEDIPRLCRTLGAQRLLWAAGEDGEARRRMLALAAQAQLPLNILPGPRAPAAARLTAQDVASLLGRGQTSPSAEAARLLHGRAVLVTGAGSVGAALCQAIMALGPSRLLVLDRDANALSGLLQALGRSAGEAIPVQAVPAAVEDEARMAEVFAAFGPDAVFHTAGFHHAALAEAAPAEAVRANVLGTLTVARAAVQAGTGRFVLASSHRAGAPSGVMAATGNLAERAVLALHTESTRCAALRLPGVLGTAGSVLPLLLGQIADGGPVTVPHRDAACSFLTLPEAARLLIETASLADRWTLLAAEGGGPVSIDALARTCIRLSGYEPDRDIAIAYTGPLPGEVPEAEAKNSSDLRESGLPGLGVLEPPAEDRALLLRQLDLLLARVAQEPAHARQALARLVPTFTTGQTIKKTTP